MFSDSFYQEVTEMKVKLRSKYFTENKTVLDNNSFLCPLQLQERKVKTDVSV